MIEQNLFIFEFVSGGGFNKQDIPSSLFCEGYAMLRAVVEDFKKLGFKITILLDRRISHLSLYLYCDVIKYVDFTDDFLMKYLDCVKKSTHCFIIAPEFSNYLYKLTQLVKQNQKILLSIDLEGIKLGTSKLDTYNYFVANKLRTPKTYKIPFKLGKIDMDFILQKFSEFGNSIIVKPEDGAGAELVFHFEEEEQILQFFKAPQDKLDLERNYIVQEYIEGEDFSVSVLNRTNPQKTGVMDCIILSINTQRVQNLSSKNEFNYLGGFTPIQNFKSSKDAVEEILNQMDLRCFHGYFGIDFIKKADDSIVLIELNPRLTTSYIGIRNILDYNPFELLLIQGVYTDNLTKLVPKRFSEFARLELKYSGKKSSEDVNEEIIPDLIKQVPEIITPPIILQFSEDSEERIYSCFISTKEKNIVASNKRIFQILKIFERYNFHEII